MKSFKQRSQLPAPQAPWRCQDLAFLESRTGAFAALWATWAVSLLEKPFSEELFPRQSFCSVATAFHYRTYSLCHPWSTQGLQTGTSWLIGPLDTQLPQEPKAFINHPIYPNNPSHVIHRPKVWKLSSACTEHRPLFEGTGQRAPSRWPWRGGFARQSVPWRCALLTMRLFALLTHAATPGAMTAEQEQSTKVLAAYSWCWKLGTYWSALLIKAFAQETFPPNSTMALSCGTSHQPLQSASLWEM